MAYPKKNIIIYTINYIWLLAVMVTKFSNANGFIRKWKCCDSSKRQLGINFQWDRCDRRLINKSGDPLNDYIIHFRNYRETIKNGFSTGIIYQQKLRKNIFFESGLRYSNIGYKTNPEILADTSGTVPIFVENVVYYNYKYLDIPMIINFNLGNRRIGANIGLGITPNILLRETDVEYFIFTNKTNKTKYEPTFNYNRINLTPNFTLGMNYKKQNTIRFKLDLVVKYSVLRIVDAPIYTYLFNTGINFSYLLPYCKR